MLNKIYEEVRKTLTELRKSNYKNAFYVLYGAFSQKTITVGDIQVRCIFGYNTLNAAETLQCIFTYDHASYEACSMAGVFASASKNGALLVHYDMDPKVRVASDLFDACLKTALKACINERKKEIKKPDTDNPSFMRLYKLGVTTYAECLKSAIKYIDEGTDDMDRYLRSVAVDAFFDSIK